jgi:predicted nucleic acid-binding Zn ribbon protein
MKRTDAESVGNLMAQWLRASGLETPLNEYRALQAWSVVVGPLVAKATTDIKIYNQTLFVKVRSSALRGNLFMQRKELVKKINERVGANVISDIMLR